MTLILFLFLVISHQLLLIARRIVIPVSAQLLRIDLFYGFSPFFMIGILL